MSRLRLTDQALVAVALARASAQARREVATVVDLLVGVAAEPEGGAGRVLRAHGTAAARLQERANGPLPRLRSLDDAVAAAARAAAPRAPDTRDLVLAALATGGEDVTDLLHACGFDPEAIAGQVSLSEDERADWAHAVETIGLPPPGQPDATLTHSAARIVAAVRAAAGGAVTLVQALIVTAADEGDLPSDVADGVTAALWNLRKRGEAGGEDWDRGLDVVVQAAERWRDGEHVTTRDLLRAAALTGGRGPAALLAELERLS